MHKRKDKWIIRLVADREFAVAALAVIADTSKKEGTPLPQRTRSKWYQSERTRGTKKCRCRCRTCVFTHLADGGADYYGNGGDVSALRHCTVHSCEH